jgi:hypothetical protein
MKLKQLIRDMPLTTAMLCVLAASLMQLAMVLNPPANKPRPVMALTSEEDGRVISGGTGFWEWFGGLFSVFSFGHSLSRLN